MVYIIFNFEVEKTRTDHNYEKIMLSSFRYVSRLELIGVENLIASVSYGGVR